MAQSIDREGANERGLVVLCISTIRYYIFTIHVFIYIHTRTIRAVTIFTTLSVTGGSAFKSRWLVFTTACTVPFRVAVVRLRQIFTAQPPGRWFGLQHHRAVHRRFYDVCMRRIRIYIKCRHGIKKSKLLSKRPETGDLRFGRIIKKKKKRVREGRRPPFLCITNVLNSNTLSTA